MKTKLDVRPDRLYRCWNPCTGTDKDGTPITVGRGERVRGDHLLVGKLGADAFIEDDDRPVSELPSPERAGLAVAGREIARRDQFERRVKEIDEGVQRGDRPLIDGSTRVDQLVRAHTKIVDSEWGSCAAGEVRRKDDPIVVNVPQCFSPLQLA